MLDVLLNVAARPFIVKVKVVLGTPPPRISIDELEAVPQIFVLVKVTV